MEARRAGQTTVRDGHKRPPITKKRYILSRSEAGALIEASDSHLTAFLWLAFGTLARPGAILDSPGTAIELAGA